MHDYVTLSGWESEVLGAHMHVMHGVWEKAFCKLLSSYTASIETSERLSRLSLF